MKKECHMGIKLNMYSESPKEEKRQNKAKAIFEKIMSEKFF